MKHSCPEGWWFAIVLSVWVFGWCSPVRGQTDLQKVQSSGVLRWGADKEGGGPFIYPASDDPDRLMGFEVELAQQLAKRLGVTAEFQQGQWDKLPELLDRGDLDIVLNGYEYTPVRAANYGVSVPYYIYELQLLVPVDQPSFQTWEELKSLTGGKKRIAVLGGSAADDYLKVNFPNQVEVVSFEGATDAMRAVELRLDGLEANLQDLPVWDFYGSGFPKLEAADKPVAQGYYVILVRKGQPELLSAINEALLAMLRDGTLREIYQRYGIWNRTQQLRALETSTDGQFVGNAGTLNSAGDDPAGQQVYIPVRGWSVIQQRAGILGRAALMTVLLSVIAMPLAIAMGLLAALLRLYGPWWLSIPSSIYVEIVRGTPLVLQLFIIFFLLPDLGISISAFWAAIAGLAINYSAYEAEVYRAGLQAIPRGQMEAAVSLGMSRWLALRRIIIPQASRLVIPPVTNDFIALFKDTAVCSVITVVELSKEYAIEARSTGAILELGLLTAVLYLSMSYPLSLLAGVLERRLQRGGQE